MYCEPERLNARRWARMHARGMPTRRTGCRNAFTPTAANTIVVAAIILHLHLPRKHSLRQRIALATLYHFIAPHGRHTIYRGMNNDWVWKQLRHCVDANVYYATKAEEQRIKVNRLRDDIGTHSHSNRTGQGQSSNSEIIWGRFSAALLQALGSIQPITFILPCDCMKFDWSTLFFSLAIYCCCCCCFFFFFRSSIHFVLFKRLAQRAYSKHMRSLPY